MVEPGRGAQPGRPRLGGGQRQDLRTEGGVESLQPFPATVLVKTRHGRWLACFARAGCCGCGAHALLDSVARGGSAAAVGAVGVGDLTGGQVDQGQAGVVAGPALTGGRIVITSSANHAVRSRRLTSLVKARCRALAGHSSCVLTQRFPNRATSRSKNSGRL